MHPLCSPPRCTRIGLFLALLALTLLPPGLPAAEVKVALQTKRAWQFEKSGVKFDNQFDGARVNDCVELGDREFKIVIEPENKPINISPWYAFRVSAAKPATITVRLSYAHGSHRYHPKVSRDGRTWAPLGTNDFRFDRPTREAVLTLRAGRAPLWVAAQELITAAEFEAWMTPMAERPFVTRSVFGRSILDQPLHQLLIHQSAETNYVFIVGRQHPPEVTGTLGLMSFVETLAGDSTLARGFRRRFRVVVLPFLNPDGVLHGHWRHNLGGLDTNRDWRQFTQPETRAARDVMERLAGEPGARVYLVLDFHSTGNDIFYTQSEKQQTFPGNFTRDWLGAIQTRFPDYEVRESSSHNPGGGTLKTWGYERFGVPSITYEFGDRTDRALVRRIAAGAAEEMMRLLLAAAEKVSKGGTSAESR